MRQSGMTVLSIAALIYIGCCAVLYVTQRSALYYPTPEARAPGADVITVESGGETLRIWHLASSPGREAILYFGGNAEDVSGNIPAFRTIFPEHDIYLANYRGYGGSTGSPSETALYEDALAIYDAIRPLHPAVSVIGRSLGSAVAVHLAASREVSKLVLVTPFDSIENVAKRALRLFPVSLLIKDRYDAARHVSDVAAPVLIVIAERDEIIPRRHSDALAAAFPASQKTVEIIRDAGHNTIDWFPPYAEALGRFLAGRRQ